MMHPTHGFTKHGHAVHGKTHDHMRSDTAYQRFNKKLAVAITTKVGSMTCAYVFTALALCSLPAILSGFHVFAHTFPSALVKASIVALVAWIAQAFLQLVLLPIIIVGQNVQAAASDVRSAKVFEDVEKLTVNMTTALDLLDTNTESGLGLVLERLDKLKPKAPPKRAK